MAAVEAEARQRLRARRLRRSVLQRLAVHFDVDCIDFTVAPLSENTGRNIGLTHGRGLRCARGGSPRVHAWARYHRRRLNPDHGAEDGSTLAAFVDHLVAALAGAAALRS